MTNGVEVGLQLHSFLMSALNGVEWSVSAPVALFRVKASSTNQIVDRIGPEPVRTILRKDKSICSARHSTLIVLLSRPARTLVTTLTELS